MRWWSSSTHEAAALQFDDVASALDAGLPFAELGGDPRHGDRTVHELLAKRGVELLPHEDLVLVHAMRAGVVPHALRARALARRQRAELLRSCWSACRYPLTLLLMLLVVSVVASGVTGPMPALVLLAAYAGITVLLALLWRTARRPGARPDEWPLLGPLWSDLRELTYLESLGALYAAGVPLVEAHRAAVDTVGAPGLRQRLELAHTQLQQGRPLHEGLVAAAALHAETRSLLNTGERAGQLEDALQRARIRRQDAAQRRIALGGRMVGRVLYGLAIVGVFLVLWNFYASYFERLGRR